MMGSRQTRSRRGDDRSQRKKENVDLANYVPPLNAPFVGAGIRFDQPWASMT
jgi:hypothetical protein